MLSKDQRPKSTNRSLRKMFAGLFALAVVVTLYGWLIDKDPNQLTGLLATLAVALGIGEGSNIGRRMTDKERLS